MGRPFVTGRINYGPEAEQQLNELDDWITKAASAEIARRFVSAILDHIDGILVFPLAGRARDDVRPGMRTSTFKKRTLVAYEVDESSGEFVVNIVGDRSRSRLANAFAQVSRTSQLRRQRPLSVSRFPWNS